MSSALSLVISATAFAYNATPAGVGMTGAPALEQSIASTDLAPAKHNRKHHHKAKSKGGKGGEKAPEPAPSTPPAQ
jgi:hypothetical protein